MPLREQWVFLPCLRQCQNEADLARCFLEKKEYFRLHLLYLQGKPRADVVMMSGATRAAFEKFAESLPQGSTPGQRPLPLQEYLELPLEHLGDYQATLRELIRCCVIRGENCRCLEQAFGLVSGLPRRAEDQLHLAMVEIVPGQLAELGELIRQDPFVVWEGQPSPRASWRGHHRHIFLFRHFLLVCKPRRGSRPDSLAYVCRTRVPLASVEVGEASDGDERTLELWPEPGSGLERLTLQARSAYLQQAWLKELQDLQEANRIAGPRPPVFWEEVVGCVARVGDTVKLQCRVSGTPRPIITWYKDGELIQADVQRSITQDEEGRCTLLVDHAAPRHAGRYRCLASNAAGSTHCEASLHILVPPRFLSHAGTVTLSEGQNMQLCLDISGQPFPTVRWLKNGHEIVEGSKYQMGVDRTQSQVSLIIRDAEHDDIGLYTCVLSNEVGESSDSVRLFEPSHMTVVRPSQAAVLVEVTEQETKMPKKTVIIEETITTVVRSPRLGQQRACSPGRYSSHSTSPLPPSSFPTSPREASPCPAWVPSFERNIDSIHGSTELADYVKFVTQGDEPTGQPLALSPELTWERPGSVSPMGHVSTTGIPTVMITSPEELMETTQSSGAAGPVGQAQWVEVEEVTEVKVKKGPRRNQMSSPVFGSSGQQWLQRKSENSNNSNNCGFDAIPWKEKEFPGRGVIDFVESPSTFASHIQQWGDHGQQAMKSNSLPGAEMVLQETPGKKDFVKSAASADEHIAEMLDIWSVFTREAAEHKAEGQVDLQNPLAPDRVRHCNALPWTPGRSELYLQGSNETIPVVRMSEDEVVVGTSWQQTSSLSLSAAQDLV
uniref:Obscurin n=1 Tax=Eptatretus burgeri TaxID=7764 RepID=A0A8C4WVN1_EPTBU